MAGLNGLYDEDEILDKGSIDPVTQSLQVGGPEYSNYDPNALPALGKGLYNAGRSVVGGVVDFGTAPYRNVAKSLGVNIKKPSTSIREFSDNVNAGARGATSVLAGAANLAVHGGVGLYESARYGGTNDATNRNIENAKNLIQSPFKQHPITTQIIEENRRKAEEKANSTANDFAMNAEREKNSLDEYNESMEKQATGGSTDPLQVNKSPTEDGKKYGDSVIARDKKTTEEKAIANGVLSDMAISILDENLTSFSGINPDQKKEITKAAKNYGMTYDQYVDGYKKAKQNSDLGIKQTREDGTQKSQREMSSEKKKLQDDSHAQGWSIIDYQQALKTAKQNAIDTGIPYDAHTVLNDVRKIALDKAVYSGKQGKKYKEGGIEAIMGRYTELSGGDRVGGMKRTTKDKRGGTEGRKLAKIIAHSKVAGAQAAGLLSDDELFDAMEKGGTNKDGGLNVGKYTDAVDANITERADDARLRAIARKDVAEALAVTAGENDQTREARAAAREKTYNEDEIARKKDTAILRATHLGSLTAQSDRNAATLATAKRNAAAEAKYNATSPKISWNALIREGLALSEVTSSNENYQYAQDRLNEISKFVNLDDIKNQRGY